MRFFHLFAGETPVLSSGVAKDLSSGGNRREKTEVRCQN